MKLPQIAKACIFFGLGLHGLLLFVSSAVNPPWRVLFEFSSKTTFGATVDPFDNPSKNTAQEVQSNQIDDALRPQQQGVHSSSRVLAKSTTSNMLQQEATTVPHHYYGAWDESEMKASNQSISIVVDLTGEFGNHLHHIAHGRVLQTLLWQDHGIASHLVLRRESNDEKYLRTQRQLKKCFPNLRSLNFHGPQPTTSLPSQKVLEGIQSTILGDDQRAQALILNGGSTFTATQASVEALVDLLQTRRAERNTTTDDVADLSLSQEVHGLSIPFVRTGSMVNRDMMDKFYDDFRGFFEFDEEACCNVADLPDPEVAVFHFRNFLGELRKGKKTGLEELSAHKVSSEVFANSTAKGVAIATRFPGRKASKEYYDKLNQHGFQPQWLTIKDDDSSPPAAMHDFCAMRRTKELVGTVRSTFVVWAALLGNAQGVARLYSVNSTWTREKYSNNGKPIFRTYNWTHPELQRRIQFELYDSEDLEAQ